VKYMLLIQQGDAPNPYEAEKWAALSEAEQNDIASAYRAINETPGVTPEAIELASRIPAAQQGGAVEVRPIMEW
jgi:hypothetical protein